MVWQLQNPGGLGVGTHGDVGTRRPTGDDGIWYNFDGGER